MPEEPTARQTAPGRAVGYARVAQAAEALARDLQRMTPTMEDWARGMQQMTYAMTMSMTVPGCTCPACVGGMSKERKAAMLEAQKRAREADQRALDLLRSCLSPRQRTQLDAGGFEVTGSEGGRYRIVTGKGSVSGNVLRLDRKGRTITGYCAHSREAMPAPDHWLLQKLALETDEAGFLRIACNVYAY